MKLLPERLGGAHVGYPEGLGAIYHLELKLKKFV